MARTGLLDVPGHEPRQAQAAGTLRLDLQPQFRRSPGLQGPHPSGGTRHGRRRRADRPFRRYPRVAVSETDWGALYAPTLDDIEALATKALRELPEPFRSLAGDVTCTVADYAEDDVLDGFGMESPFELMGLFVGIGLTEDGAVPQTGQLPNTVFLYRRAILDYWAENDDNTLGEVVTHVLIHELGHHFGFSDDDMEAIEAAADAEQAAEDL